VRRPRFVRAGGCRRVYAGVAEGKAALSDPGLAQRTV
jgi:hypothetical protein